MAFQPLDLSNTHRIVLLIDLNPIFLLQNPNTYIFSLLSAAQSLLSIPSLSSSLFSFGFFFSSLSPLLSSSKTHKLLGKSSNLSFDLPSQTLISLFAILNSIPSLLSSSSSELDCSGRPRASLTAESLRQILYDYPWDSPLHAPKGTLPQILTLRSNLIVLFSPFPKSPTQLSEFVDAEYENEEAFCSTFVQIFGGINQGFVSRDIHLCWLDVNVEDEFPEEGDQGELGIRFIRKGITSLGWSVSSTDAITLGPSLVPRGLIYPNITCSIGNKSFTCPAELSLEILDVKGKPLECKFSDLGLVVGSMIRKKLFSSNAFAKIHLKEMCKNEDLTIKEDCISDFVLLRGFSGKSEEEKKIENLGGYFVNKVLEMLQMGENEFVAGKPAWQLLLNFLHKEAYMALVSVSNVEGTSALGILKPFTIHSAVLCILDSSITCEEIFETKVKFNSLPVSTVSQAVSSSYSNSVRPSSCEKNKRNKKNIDSLGDFTWNSFRKAVLSSMNNNVGFELDLEDIYFAKECNNSKKLRFLKCWMKQMKRSYGSRQIKPDVPKEDLNLKETVKSERVLDPQQENKVSISPSSVIEEKNLNKFKNGEVPVVSCLRTDEAFLESISQKIQQSLDSEEVDLGFFAERLVDSAIHWLYTDRERDDTENPVLESPDNSSCATVVAEVEKLLLRKPRDLASKYRGCNTSEKKVREHELQILFRMEILQSKVGASTEEAERQKMIKEICSLLENIEFNLQGGLFGGQSLVEFAGRTIKNRYAHSLQEVIRRIYTKMEFLSSDEEETSISLHDSSGDGDERLEENNIEKNACGESIQSTDDKSISVENESSEPHEDDMNKSLKISDMVQHKRKLTEARDKRERARRFASFTSWVPDLQRVWVAKQQPRAMMSWRPESSRRLSKRQRRQTVRTDVVCETPMTRMKHITHPGGNAVMDEERVNSLSNSYESAKSKKVLFQSEENTTTSSLY